MSFFSSLAAERLELPSHLGPAISAFGRDLTADRLVLTADGPLAYPAASLLALEVVSGGLPALRGAETVANTVDGIWTGDIAASAERLTFDAGNIRIDAGDRIEGCLPGLVWPSADTLPQAMEAGR